MSKPQYAILRFAKYKGPEIGNIEAHNERTKEKYASNPDVDISRSKNNFHLIEPKGKYRAEAERQIKEVGCRTRSDSVRVVEALVTATPEFFQGKKKSEIRAYFQEALAFLQQNQDPKTIISAVVHMDEKTPHMHLSFVPLTADGRLSAKEIVGNKKKLTQWQDKFWEHMVRKYPDLERGESASQTGRDHIPPRVFKEMTRLTKQKAKLEELLAGIGVFNAKSRAAEIAAFEHIQILFPVAGKVFGDLQLIERAQQAEIANTPGDILLQVPVKIALKFKGLGVLVVDGRTGNIPLIGARLVGEHNMLPPRKHSAVRAQKRHNS